MLFLINDVVFDLAKAELSLAGGGPSLPAAFSRLRRNPGRRAFRRQPAPAGEQEPERAPRLAVMIVAIAPRINAALFSGPGASAASPQAVGVRFETVVHRRACRPLGETASRRSVTAWLADSQVWRRLAA